MVTTPMSSASALHGQAGYGTDVTTPRTFIESKPPVVPAEIATLECMLGEVVRNRNAQP